jgi:mono/diheme cytochrome c family protein
MPQHGNALMRPWRWRSLHGTAAASAILALLASLPAAAAASDPERSRAAFAEIARVLRHPRCINCHTVTDFPRQGDESRPHDMLVKRGPDGHGREGLECSSCHQDQNQEEAGVPGAPRWALAPLSMGWEGLDDHALAEALKDPARNGGLSLEGTYEHMAQDPLVGWAWNPGGERRPPPISRQELARWVRVWIDTGAHSPPPSGGTGAGAPSPAGAEEDRR